ncbi:MAG: DUF349 domain-containing protein [Flavobacteriaceae bacterium]
MLEEQEQERPKKAEAKAPSETTETTDVTEKSTELPTEKETPSVETNTTTKDAIIADSESDLKKAEIQPDENTGPKENASPAKNKLKDDNLEREPLKVDPTVTTEPKKAQKADQKDDSEKVLEEIDDENAEDAEDADNHHRHNIPILDYHAMSMENLVGELQRLVRNEKVQAIKKHVDEIKQEFDQKFQEFIEHKKEDFVNNGGNEIDFRYNSVAKRQFNEVYKDYREKRNQYYKSLEKSHKENLSGRLELIEELKALINVEEDINTTYKNFKDIQQRWREAGPVPRTHYNDVWKTYHHHIEIFYDFLHINRELRDLDFKHNLEEKTKIVEQAEALAKDPDLNKAFRELQTLHKIWKEDIGPVGQEHREAIWERFSNATKVMHQRRQDHYKDIEKSYEQNLEKKRVIITEIHQIANSISNNHRALQQQMKQVEALRDAFFKAGKVPQQVNEKTWADFKEAVRTFNRGKNAYYKTLKSEQQENLDKKRELLQLAQSLKDSEEWESTTSEMKRIQNEWKKVGHVPRKYSDKLWKEFKTACNHYFDRLHALKNSAHKEEAENFEKKAASLDKLRAFELTGNREKDIETIKTYIRDWKTFGRVPFNKKNIDQKFDKIVDALFRKLNVNKQESELLKYGNKIQQLAKKDDEQAIYNERVFIRRKIDESKNEILQLENNLQFFSNASEDNPLVQDVVKRVESHKASLATWKEKLKKLNILENKMNRPEEEEEADASPSEEE